MSNRETAKKILKEITTERAGGYRVLKLTRHDTIKAVTTFINDAARGDYTETYKTTFYKYSPSYCHIQAYYYNLTH